MLPKGIEKLPNYSGLDDLIRVRMYLLPGEDVLVKVELDLFIGDVDAELLKRVPLKVFKAEDVQDADVQTLVFLPGEKFKDRTIIHGILKMPTFPECLFTTSANGLPCWKRLLTNVWLSQTKLHTIFKQNLRKYFKKSK